MDYQQVIRHTKIVTQPPLGKKRDNSRLAVAQTRRYYSSGVHCIQALIEKGGDSCVIGFSEKKFEVDNDHPQGNMV